MLPGAIADYFPKLELSLRCGLGGTWSIARSCLTFDQCSKPVVGQRMENRNALIVALAAIWIGGSLNLKNRGSPNLSALIGDKNRSVERILTPIRSKLPSRIGGITCQRWLAVGQIHNVDDFVTAKALNFHRLQQLSTDFQQGLNLQRLGTR